jgi:hypothetical protein
MHLQGSDIGVIILSDRHRILFLEGKCTSLADGLNPSSGWLPPPRKAGALLKVKQSSR